NSTDNISRCASWIATRFKSKRTARRSLKVTPKSPLSKSMNRLDVEAPNAFGANFDSMRATRPPLHRTKVGMISLGCAKNLVDAEIMLGSVLQHGMEITASADEA